MVAVVRANTFVSDTLAISVNKQPKAIAQNVITDLAHLNETVQQLSQFNINTSVTSTDQFRTFPTLDNYRADATGIVDDALGEFTKENINKWIDTSPKTDTILYSAKQLFQEIFEHDKFIGKMTGNELIDLPVGIKKSVGGNADQRSNTSITIGVVKAKIFPEYSELDLFAKLEIGELNTTLFFGASGVKLSHTGGIYGEARLNLLADVPVGQNGGQWLLTFKGNLDNSTGTSESPTYITIDCEGNVKEIAIAADVRIAKTVAVPINEDGSHKFPNDITPGEGKSPINNASYVGANFRVVVASLDDLIVEVNLPRFELKKLPKWGFQMKNALLDLSDTRNALTKVSFPAIYTEQQLLVPGNEKLWRGFYSEEITITLPPEFKKKNSDKRITVGAKNLIIDNFGVSGNFYAINVLDINEGNASKWQFSVDKIAIDLQVNHFVKATFNGEIVLPISTIKGGNKTDTVHHGALKYAGLITADRHYNIRVDVAEDVDFSIFKSKAKLFRDSYIKLEVKDGKFQPEANLTGLMSFNKSQGAALDTLGTQDVDSGGGIEDLNFEGLSFQNFKIQTASRPYLSIEYMGYKDTLSLPKIYGFELGFYDIRVNADKPDNSAELGFNGYINLDESGIRGDVRLRIIGELVEGDYLKWKYKGIEVDSIEIDVKRKSFEFNGKLYFFRDHEIYGKGLRGSLRLYAESLGLEMAAQGIFGNVDGYRYWYVDANGRPTNSNNKSFKIYDLGGGVYHHMRKAGVDERASTMSGIHYTPDRAIDFGFKALAAFEVKKSSTFTGLVAIEMSFNASGGVNRLGFYGAASLMNGNSTPTGSSGKKEPFGSVSDMQKTVSDKEQSLANFHELSIDKEGVKYFATEVFPDLLTGEESFAAQVAIDFDFTNDTYWGMFDVFLNTASIKGDGEKNRLGYLEFYSAPDDWYIYVGTPTKRFGVRDIPIGPYKARVNLYFMAGTILPDPALPPDNVIDILNLKGDELLFGRNFKDDLAVGNGYAFGAEFALGIGFDWGIVYASVEAGVGFDLMMRNFGDAHCRGSEERVGKDGWYATGQLYAYLQGEIGAQIKIFGLKKRIPILKAGIAVLAQAQLPNPWYMKGYAGIEVRVLGVVTVKARLKVIIGEECEIIGNTGLQNIMVISDIMPSDQTTNVDVFEAVQVAFNVPINDEIVVEEDNGRKTYRVSLKEFSVKSEGGDVLGDISWNTNKDLLIFESTEILPPEKTITAIVKIGFEEKINGAWKLSTDNSGKVIEEEKTITFTTGKAPTKIRLKDIEYMYPIVDQRYFFPKESKVGYVQIEKGREDLFIGEGFVNELFYTDENGQSQKVGFSYNVADKKLMFDIPTLQTQTKYTYKLITTVPGGGSDQDNATQETFTAVSDDVSISNNTITEGASSNAVFVRLTFDFNTSKHHTFVEKMNSLSVSNYYTLIDGASDIGAMGLGMNEYEPFGINDILGTKYTNNIALVNLEGNQTDFYYTNRIQPLVYKNYPLDGTIYLKRDVNILGFPPVRSMKISNTYSYYVSANPNAKYLKENFPFRWHLAWAYKQDFKDLQYQMVNKYTVISKAVYEQYGYIINGIFPYLEQEYYEVKAKYLLPNKSLGNSTIIKYRNDF